MDEGPSCDSVRSGRKLFLAELRPVLPLVRHKPGQKRGSGLGGEFRQGRPLITHTHSRVVQ